MLFKGNLKKVQTQVELRRLPRFNSFPTCQPLRHWHYLVTFIKPPLFKVLNVLQFRELMWGAGKDTPRDKQDVEPSSDLLKRED